MVDVIELKKELQTARSELKNIRHQLAALKKVCQKDITSIRDLLEQRSKDGSSCATLLSEEKRKVSCMPDKGKVSDSWQFRPVGFVQSVFMEKNGTPRQANVCQSSQAVIEISKDLYNNPEHSLEGLSEYSHLWLLYVFHKNNSAYNKAKVAPPRLNGIKLGVFSTRSPYRPCPIGLSLVRLDHISGHCLHLSGVDILNGTPVLDIKPYIPQYDNPEWGLFLKNPLDCLDTGGRLPSNKSSKDGSFDESSFKTSSNPDLNMESMLTSKKSQLDDHKQCFRSEGDDKDLLHSTTNLEAPCDAAMITDHSISSKQKSNSNNESQYLDVTKKNTTDRNITIAQWIQKPPIPTLTVIFSNRAENDLRIVTAEQHPSRSIAGEQSTREAIVSILAADPRSTYRRQHCTDRLYYFTVDQLHVTSWFEDDVVEVLRIKMLTTEPRRQFTS